MDLDKYLVLGDLEELPSKKLEEGCLERLIFNLFHIDVTNLIKIKALLTKEFHIAPSEIDRMDYWEYELWLRQIQQIVSEQNEQQESEYKKYNLDQYKDPSKFQPKLNTPSFENMPNMSIPKFD